MSKPQSVTIICADGVALAGLIVVPEKPKSTVTINGGTGFPKEFYLPFAQYLAENGFVALVYDYRGTCGSAPENMRDCTYAFLDYGQKDMPAALDFMDARFPDLPKLVVGHSVGGQQIGFMPNHHKIGGLVSFATSVGYLGFMPWSYRIKAWYFFHIVTPISIALKGYVAVKKLNIMEDLPRQVVLDWRDWCSVPDYFFDAKYYGRTVPVGDFENLNFPIHVIWSIDDPIANGRAIATFWRRVKSSKGIDIQKITPQEYGLKKIDHYGLFRRQSRETLWPLVLNKLENQLATIKSCIKKNDF